ncbi:Ataxin-7-like protein 3, partial [Fragariocoptes setiger]
MDEEILSTIIDNVIFGECLQVHRAAKLGLIFIEPEEDAFKIKDQVGSDVFGQPMQKKTYNIKCPNCDRNLAAGRLAPHLEKCISSKREGPRFEQQRSIH